VKECERLEKASRTREAPAHSEAAMGDVSAIVKRLPL